MELETINKLFLELSQIATARTARELKMLRLLEDAKSIAMGDADPEASDDFITDYNEFLRELPR